MYFGTQELQKELKLSWHYIFAGLCQLGSLAFMKFEITTIVYSRVLARLVLKHMKAFSDCLWRRFSILMYSNPFDKKLVFQLVTLVNTRNFTVCVGTNVHVVHWIYIQLLWIQDCLRKKKVPYHRKMIDALAKLGTSDTWPMSCLAHRPSDPACYIEDWLILIQIRHRRTYIQCLWIKDC